jgi:hypothetical protein
VNELYDVFKIPDVCTSHVSQVLCDLLLEVHILDLLLRIEAIGDRILHTRDIGRRYDRRTERLHSRQRTFERCDRFPHLGRVNVKEILIDSSMTSRLGGEVLKGIARATRIIALISFEELCTFVGFRTHFQNRGSNTNSLGTPSLLPPNDALGPSANCV